MLSESQLVRYFEDGFLIVEGLFSRDELKPSIDDINDTVDEIARELRQAGKIKDSFEEEGFYTRLTKLEEACPGVTVKMHIRGVLKPAWGRLWSNPKLLDIVGQMIGPEIAGHPVWNIRCKTPVNPLATVPWHQDTAYMVAGCEHTLQPTVWIPLLDARGDNGTLQVIRSGHSSEKVFPHHQKRKIGNPKSWYVYIDDADLPDGEIVTCEMDMGSVLFINQLLPHRSTENVSDMIRWSFDFRWQDPSLFNGMNPTDCILMRTKADSDYRIRWPEWTQKNRTELTSVQKNSEGGSTSCVDVTVDGHWLKRWAD
jgi:hypothetical protein